MVKIDGIKASAWVSEGNYSVKLDLTDLLKEVFFSDPRKAKKVILGALKKHRAELNQKLERIKEDRKKMELIYKALDKILNTPEFQRELLRYPPKERRKIRRVVKEIVKDGSSGLDYIDYELERTLHSLEKVRKFIKIIENTDPDLLEIEFREE